MSYITEVMHGHFVILLPILAKMWLPGQRPLHPCNQKFLLWIGRPRKPPVISNHIVAISQRNPFIAILVPKFVAMVTYFWPLYTGVSQMYSPIAHTLSQNQTLHEYDAYNWSYDHFCDILAYFSPPCLHSPSLPALILRSSPMWLPWQRPVHSCSQKCFLWIGWRRKPMLWVIAFLLSLAERYLYAFIAILVPKLVAMVTPLCQLCKVCHRWIPR